MYYYKGSDINKNLVNTYVIRINSYKNAAKTTLTSFIKDFRFFFRISFKIHPTLISSTTESGRRLNVIYIYIYIYR